MPGGCWREGAVRIVEEMAGQFEAGASDMAPDDGFGPFEVDLLDGVDE